MYNLRNAQLKQDSQTQHFTQQYRYILKQALNSGAYQRNNSLITQHTSYANTTNTDRKH